MTNKQFIVEADFFKALAHPTRIQILEFLRTGEKCVCEITPTLGKEQPNISRHLAILKKEGLVQSRKDGLKVIYRISDPKVYTIIDLSAEIIRRHLEDKAFMVK
jgi:DNA-binding transcriptional ArsR family regulator